MKGIRKSFPGVQAIDRADFDLRRGEIHALVGENGAGKSTLIKILTGVHRADSGDIRFNETEVDFRTPLDAQQAGIATIYQEFTLIPAMTVSENVFLGREISRHGIARSGLEQEKATQLFSRLGVTVDPRSRVAELSVAHQQLVEIARALARETTVLVMDEPTASLAPREVEHLFSVLRELAADGIGIIFISHRLDEVFSIADRITVMRDGVTIGTSRPCEITRAELIEQMVNRPIDQEYPRTDKKIGDVSLEVRGLSGGIVDDVSFEVRCGEVLGLAGLMGAGRTEMVRLIFGADRRQKGEIRLADQALTINSARDAIANGICLLTEDRKLQGLVLRASARENFALPNLSSWSRYGWIDRDKESRRFESQIAALRMRIAHPDQRAEELSGGNQQKLLVARWLETNSQVIIFDEPTRGIDVGAKYDMYLLIGELARQGKAILVVSSELPELLGICDRIVVMRRGRVAGRIDDVREATQENIMALAV